MQTQLRIGAASNAVKVKTHVKAGEMHSNHKATLVQSTSRPATGLKAKTPSKAGRQLGKPTVEDEGQRAFPVKGPNPTSLLPGAIRVAEAVLVKN